MQNFFSIEIPSLLAPTQYLKVIPFEIHDDEIQELIDDGFCDNEIDAVREILNDHYDECDQQFVNSLVITETQFDELKKIIKEL